MNQGAYKLMVDWLFIIGLIVIIIQCLKLRWKIPGPALPLIGVLLAVPFGLVNVYLPIWLSPIAVFGIQGGLVAVGIAFGVVGIGKKAFEKPPE
jgi:hypothetical protein